ncbi:MAG: DinB family protein [bacterium]|nr:DinB family protein [bacterium]
MGQVKWFERKFEYPSEQNILPSIIERLGGTHIRLVQKLDSVNEELLTRKIEDTWSILENLGHLNDLEPLWQGRLNDIITGNKFLREADLENTKTNIANHNEIPLEMLLEQFEKLRLQTVENLKNLSENQAFLSALHPRLQTPMRVIDLFSFVADHDDHHLARMTEILDSL